MQAHIICCFERYFGEHLLKISRITSAILKKHENFILFKPTTKINDCTVTWKDQLPYPKIVLPWTKLVRMSEENTSIISLYYKHQRKYLVLRTEWEMKYQIIQSKLSMWMWVQTQSDLPYKVKKNMTVTERADI